MNIISGDMSVLQGLGAVSAGVFLERSDGVATEPFEIGISVNLRQVGDQADHVVLGRLLGKTR